MAMHETAASAGAWEQMDAACQEELFQAVKTRAKVLLELEVLDPATRQNAQLLTTVVDSLLRDPQDCFGPHAIAWLRRHPVSSSEDLLERLKSSRVDPHDSRKRVYKKLYDAVYQLVKNARKQVSPAKLLRSLESRATEVVTIAEQLRRLVGPGGAVPIRDTHALRETYLRLASVTRILEELDPMNQDQTDTDSPHPGDGDGDGDGDGGSWGSGSGYGGPDGSGFGGPHGGNGGFGNNGGASGGFGDFQNYDDLCFFDFGGGPGGMDIARLHHAARAPIIPAERPADAAPAERPAACSPATPVVKAERPAAADGEAAQPVRARPSSIDTKAAIDSAPAAAAIDSLAAQLASTRIAYSGAAGHATKAAASPAAAAVAAAASPIKTAPAVAPPTPSSLSSAAAPKTPRSTPTEAQGQGIRDVMTRYN